MSQDGRATWTPAVYGEHVLECGTLRRSVWVTSRPMIFNWWTTKTYPRFITAAMVHKGHSAGYWERRGIVALNWIGGAWYAFGSGKDPFREPEQWFRQWRKSQGENLARGGQGACLDELFATDERWDGVAIPKAVAMFRRAIGDEPPIGVYYAGIMAAFPTGMWYLRMSDVYHLEENYWGGEKIARLRWSDVSLYRVQNRAVLVIAPGFRLENGAQGSLTPEELREEFAMVRRVAPDAAGLGVFNAYDRPDLETLCDELIEQYFLRAVVHIQPRDGRLLARNIGNEDAKGVAISFVDGGNAELGRVPLRVLKPLEEQEVAIPPESMTARVNVPEGAVDICPDGGYVLPSPLNPLRVREASIDDLDVVASEDGNITFRAVFNRALAPGAADAANVFMSGVLSGQHQPRIEYDGESHVLHAVFENLPADFYTLRLLSGAERFRDTEGLPLDGSDNGLLDERNDDFAVHFRLVRDGEHPVLPIPAASGDGSE